MSGNYADNVSAYLTSPAYDFSGATALFLSFTHYYDAESGFDGGNVQVKNGTDWVTLTPKGGYPIQFLSGLGNEDGYSGASDGWVPAVFDLTPYIGGSVEIRFHFGSDSGINGPGWYIDDVAFDLGDSPASAGAATDPAALSLLAAQPNPFHDQTSIRVTLPSPAGSITIRILDPAGRGVKRWDRESVGSGLLEFVWDGTDASGHHVPGGVYLCAIEVDGGRIKGQSLICIR